MFWQQQEKLCAVVKIDMVCDGWEHGGVASQTQRLILRHEIPRNVWQACHCQHTEKRIMHSAAQLAPADLLYENHQTGSPDSERHMSQAVG